MAGNHPTRPVLDLTRRRFLGRGAAGAAAVVLGPTLLAACGGGDDSASSGGGGGGENSGGKNLRNSNWPVPLADGFVASFQMASGLKVTYKEDFNDNEEWFAKVKVSLKAGQDIGTDLVVPSEFMAARLIRLGWLEKLDDSKLPNK